MKRQMIGIIVAKAILLSACSDPGRKTTALYKADPGQSHVFWTSGSRHGSMMPGEGSFMISGNKIEASCSIDLNTLKADDVDSAISASLTRQLQSPQFFDLSHSPILRLELTGERILPETALQDARYKLTGSLGLKGTAIPITFPATVRNNARVATIDATFAIKWQGELPDSMSRSMSLRLHLVGNM